MLTKTFDILQEIIMEYQKLCAQKNEDFDQTHLNTGSKTQNVEKLSLDLIFHINFWKNIKSFSKQNSVLRIHSKLDRNQSKMIHYLKNKVGVVDFANAQAKCPRTDLNRLTTTTA